MELLIGLMLILWGVFILYSVLFRMKEKDYKDKGVFGVNEYIELEFFFRLLSKFPSGVIKGVVILIGLAFIVTGIIIL